MKNDLWVIEARTSDGKLDLTAPQPESVFGNAAITGITDDAMAKIVYRHVSDDVSLDGRMIGLWPARIDSRWIARRKTW